MNRPPCLLPPGGAIDALRPATAVIVFEVDPSGERARTDSVGLRHALDAFGIPYAVTSDLSTALRTQEVLAVIGDLDGAVAKERGDMAAAVATWAEAPGHTLWIAGVASPAILGPLGLAARRSPSTESELVVNAEHPLAVYANTQEERLLPLVDAEYRLTYAAAPSDHRIAPVATYADGTAGIVTSDDTARARHAVVFGDTFTAVLTRLETGHGRPLGCTNAFFPALDTVRLILKRSYETVAKRPSLAPLAPDGKRAAVVLTHDMDGSSSFMTWQDIYMPLEVAHGFTSTLFVTTSYRDTHYIRGFYADPANREILRQSLAAGFELQSHSVSHAPDFAAFPLGVDVIDEAAYTPTYSADAGTEGGAVLPELSLSRQLLESDFGIKVRGFRSGYLAKPHELPSAEEDVGYQFDSSSCAGEIGGAAPFLLLGDYTTKARQTGVLEIPLSISDKDINSRTREEMLATWIDVTTKTAANGAPTVILVHPTPSDTKPWVYTRWLEWVSTQPDLWVGSMGEYADWYTRRGRTSALASSPY